MPTPYQRSRSFRRVSVKFPGGRVSIHYRKRNPSAARCMKCKRVLQGIPRARAIELRRIPKSSRRPERPYGGQLCSSCMRNVFVEKARALSFSK